MAIPRILMNIPAWAGWSLIALVFFFGLITGNFWLGLFLSIVLLLLWGFLNNIVEQENNRLKPGEMFFNLFLYPKVADAELSYWTDVLYRSSLLAKKFEKCEVMWFDSIPFWLEKMPNQENIRLIVIKCHSPKFSEPENPTEFLNQIRDEYISYAMKEFSRKGITLVKYGWDYGKYK
ncbi:hypothetical protein H0O01_03430 [Candidatus Micrarchaeota archaeon]|nr:hypothetical protein [Candidatus Micrarchaeota archaeon]